MATKPQTTRVVCEGFHGISRITLDEDRLLKLDDEAGIEREYAWLSPSEMKDNSPCGMKDCTCCDTFQIREVKDGGFGDCLVCLF